MVIDYTPHAAQMEIHKAREARFRTVCTGRRFGKTLCMAAELLDRGGGEAGGDYGWIAPTYGVAERGVEAFKMIAPEFVRFVGRMPTRAEFEGAAGPCRVWFLSALKEWEEARRTLPEDVFRQEYMAEFLEDSAGVFRGVDGCLIADTGEEAHAEARRTRSGGVVVGCDIAKHTDWTVCIAMEARTGRCLGMERFNRLDWPVQRERIAGFVKHWGGRLVMDATGIGDPVFDDLRRELPDAEGFRITAQTKRELVQGLMVAVEQRGATWPAARIQDSGFRRQKSE